MDRFAPHRAWDLKHSSINRVRWPYDTRHSSEQSTTINALEKVADTDCKALEISSIDSRVRFFLWLLWRDFTLLGREDRPCTSYFNRLARRSISFWPFRRSNIQRYVIPILLSFSMQVVRCATTTDINIVFPAPGMLGQNNISFPVLSHRWNIVQSRSN